MSLLSGAVDARQHRTMVALAAAASRAPHAGASGPTLERVRSSRAGEPAVFHPATPPGDFGRREVGGSPLGSTMEPGRPLGGAILDIGPIPHR
jgi:hypothetical protein